MEEESKCPKWEKFMNEVLGEKSQAKIRFACKSKLKGVPVRLIFYSEGLGKSVAQTIINRALGFKDDEFVSRLDEILDNPVTVNVMILFDAITFESDPNPLLLEELSTELPAIKEWLLN